MMQMGSEMATAMMTNEIIMVPDKMVGLIIGRGGEQITRLQSESGCKIQMAADSQGLPDRQCTLTGPPGAIGTAKLAIERIIANEGSGGRGPPGMGGPQMGGGFFEMIVAGHKVGLIIGKGGETIKHLQESTGAKIIIVQDSAEFASEKPLRITGSPESVERAKSLVNEILNQNDDREPMGYGMRDAGRGRGRGVGRGMGMPMRGTPFIPRGRGRGGFDRGGGTPGHWSGPPSHGGQDYSAQHQDYVSIPSNKCGLVIGKGGETIKNINQTSGAHCEVDKNAPPDARDKNFIIRGTHEAVEKAKAMILEKLGMQSSGPPGSSYGGPPSGGSSYGGSWGGQYQAPGGMQHEPPSVNPSTGQADYSAQWIEYYRSQGMMREAEAVEQQARAARSAPSQSVPSGLPSGNGTTNGQADYSAQWAEYYRSLGKHKEAEAIELQMKQKTSTPQPFGASGGQFTAPGYYGGAVNQPGSAYPNFGGGYSNYPSTGPE